MCMEWNGMETYETLCRQGASPTHTHSHGRRVLNTPFSPLPGMSARRLHQTFIDLAVLAQWDKMWAALDDPALWSVIDANVTDAAGNTVLHHAVRHAHTDTVVRLLGPPYRANAAARTVHGCYVLDLAIASRPAILRAVLDAGGARAQGVLEPTPSITRRGPLHIAMWHVAKATTVAEAIDRRTNLQLLLEVMEAEAPEVLLATTAQFPQATYGCSGPSLLAASVARCVRWSPLRAAWVQITVTCAGPRSQETMEMARPV